jgi:outer membrane biosynthesis protein TonB
VRIALAGLVVATVAARAALADPSKGLSLEQIRGVMRANAPAFNACLAAATRSGKPLHGPFLYDIEVDKKGKVTAARPFQPSPVAAFDKCVIGVLRRARFPGGPASVEAPLVFDPS